MSRLLSSLTLWLLLLVAVQPASGMMGVSPENRVWDFFAPEPVSLWEIPSPDQYGTREAEGYGYEFASDVCDGPNLYAYVRQNPWSKFDPDGLDDKEVKSKSSYRDPNVVFMADEAQVTQYYKAWVDQRRKIYKNNEFFLEKNLFTTAKNGPETVALTATAKKDSFGNPVYRPGTPGKPAMNPDAENIWKQIFVDDGQGKNGQSSQLGECASLPINLAKVPADTKTWKRGPQVLGNDEILPGTALATYDKNGNYNGKAGGHSCLFVSQTKDSITVLEQFNPGHAESGNRGGRCPQLREIARGTPGNTDYANSAEWFHVIQTEK